ncbi:MAG: hypothetical protein QG657_1031 [Acidobacteriota bacterium]|nr:hypothetical protein [Acidobacteriota bacterium]
MNKQAGFQMKSQVRIRAREKSFIPPLLEAGNSPDAISCVQIKKKFFFDLTFDLQKNRI